MCNPEALLFVNDQQPQVFIFYIFGKDPVCADHNIHQSLSQVFYGLFLFCGSPEPA